MPTIYRIDDGFSVPYPAGLVIPVGWETRVQRDERLWGNGPPRAPEPVAAPEPAQWNIVDDAPAHIPAGGIAPADLANLLVQPRQPRRRENIFDNLAPQAVPAPDVPVYTPDKEVVFLGPTRQPFFLPYETREEANLRLTGSVIRLDGQPVCIMEVRDGTAGNLYNLIFQKADGTIQMHGYREGSGFDLAPLPARYIWNDPRHNRAHWCFRKPMRGVYRQGAIKHNTFIKEAGLNATNSIGSGSNIINAYKAKNDLRPAVDAIPVILTADGKRSLALSDTVSVFFKSPTRLGIEFKGVPVGTFGAGDVSEGIVRARFKEDFPPWLMRHLNDVGIEVRT
jgi:hypothetical protein